MKLRIIGCIMIIVFLLSCGNKVADLQKITDAKAAELNDIAKKIISTAHDGAKVIEKALENQKNLNLNISKMDKSAGGEWDWNTNTFYTKSYAKVQELGYTLVFYNGLYYPFTDNKDLVSKNIKANSKFLKPEDEEFKQVKLDLLTVESVVADWKKIGDILPEKTWFFYLMFPFQGITMYSIPMDIISSVAPGLTYDIFYNYTPFFAAGVPEGNPELNDKWVGNDAWVGGAGEGWIRAAVSIIKLNGKFVGHNYTNILIQPLAKQFIEPMKENVLFISVTGAILGMSNPVKTMKVFKNLEEFNYLEQLKSEPKFIDQFMLTDVSQPQDIQDLGKKILAGETNFKMAISGTTYTFVSSVIPELNYRIVGFIK